MAPEWLDSGMEYKMFKIEHRLIELLRGEKTFKIMCNI